MSRTLSRCHFVFNNELAVLRVEKKEAEVKKMLATVLKDKEKIEATIEELDRYKRDALEKTWEKVDGYVFLSCATHPYLTYYWCYLVISEGYLRNYCRAILQNYSHRKGKI